MEDLTGLGKLADSKIVNKTYDDLLSEAAKEGGGVLQDTVKAFRLFTAPIQLLSVAQDRLAAFCERVRNGVPEERQIEAAPSIALPILLDLRYMEDDNPITSLYLNLLQRAIDRERVQEAHPAFAKIIGLLSPDEVMILHNLTTALTFTQIDTSDLVGDRFENFQIVEQEFPVDKLVCPENYHVCVSHLQSLDLVIFPVTKQDAILDSKQIQTGNRRTAILELSDFGKMFVNACEP